MNDIYDSFNDIEYNFEEFEEMPLNDIEKKKIKKDLKVKIKKLNRSNKKGRNKKIKVAAIVAGITLSLAVAPSYNPLARETHNLVDGIMYKFIYSKEIEKLPDYVTLVDKTVKSGNYEVTIKEIVADDNNFEMAYRVHSDTKKVDSSDMEGLFLGGSVYINGKKLNSGVGGSSIQIDKNTVEAMLSYNFTDIKLKDKMKVKIEFTHMFGEEGDWIYEFAASKENLVKKTKVVKLDEKLNIKGKDIELKAAKFSPIKTILEYKKDIKSDEIEKEEEINFIVKREDGRNLNIESYGGDENSSNEVLNPIGENTKSVTIIPVVTTTIREKDKDDSKKYNAIDTLTEKLPLENKPMEIKLGKNKSIFIAGYEEKDNKVIIRYKTNQKDFIMGPIDLMVCREDGKKLTSVKDDNIMEKRSKYSNGEEVTVTYKKPKSGKLFVFARTLDGIEILEDQAIKIDIN